MIASIIKKKVSLHAILEMVHHCDELRRATKFTIIDQKPIRGFVRSTLYRDLRSSLAKDMSTVPWPEVFHVGDHSQIG